MAGVEVENQLESVNSPEEKQKNRKNRRIGENLENQENKKNFPKKKFKNIFFILLT